MVHKLCNCIKLVLPETTILLGGPEVSYDAETILAEHANIDIIIRDEGEVAFKAFINGTPLSQIGGVTYRDGDKIISNATTTPLPLADIPFAYNKLNGLENKIIYYETSRGCPNSCGYCLSGDAVGVRFLPLKRVCKELEFFLKSNVKQVKFVDRTFNCNPAHARAVWNFLIENDNGHTNFHFEISADIITDDDIALLKNARPGLFQFEVGVQSTNIDVLGTIARKTNLPRLYNSVGNIKALGNIHLHLDLIAGLPGENYQSFLQSFDDVYALEPNKLQLGFLKLLKGSRLRTQNAELGLMFKPHAPYEVLRTAQLSFDEIITLKTIEHMLDVYYNSGLFRNTLRFVVPKFSSPSVFFESLAHHFTTGGYEGVSHSKITTLNILHDFCATLPEKQIIEDLLRFDMLLNENIHNLPQWAVCIRTDDEKHKIKNFYRNTNNADKYFGGVKNVKSSRIEAFSFDILELIESGFSNINKTPTEVLFIYTKKIRTEKVVL